MPHILGRMLQGVFSMRCFAWVAVAAPLLLASPARADEAPPAPQSTPSCELHIWAAPALKTMTQSMIWNHTVDQAMNGAHPTAGLSAQALSPAKQLALLEASHDIAALGVAAPQVVRHEQPLDEHASQSAIRHDPSASHCYAELVVSHLVYESDPMTGHTLSILFQFRDFGSGATPVRSFATWSHRPLTIFPAKTEADSAAAATELDDAFAGGFADFILNMSKAEAKARPKANRHSDNRGAMKNVAS